MDKKKILFITWSFSMGGGAEKILANITKGLSDEYVIDVLEINNHGTGENRDSNINILKPLFKNLENATFLKKLSGNYFCYFLNYLDI